MDTYETLVRVTEELDVARDLLAGVRDYYQAKIAEQQNDVAKKLTVIASLVLVPSLIVGFYGQNFADAFDDRLWTLGTSIDADRRLDPRPARDLPLAALDLAQAPRPPVSRLPSTGVSAPAHTSSPDGSFTASPHGSSRRSTARCPYAGPRSHSRSGRSRSDVGRSTSTRRRRSPPRPGRSRTSSSARSPTTPRAPATSRSSSPSSRGTTPRSGCALPSVLAGVVAAIAAYRLGRRLAGRHAGAAASLLLASSLGVVLSDAHGRGRSARARGDAPLERALRARGRTRQSRSGGRSYAVSAALLPLTHPIAASALAAQLVALALARHRVDLRAGPPRGRVATVECGLFLVAAALDRADAPDGAGPLELADLGTGVGRAFGWSPVLAALASGASCGSGAGMRARRLEAALVTGLVAMPLVFVLAAGAVLPVFPREALTAAAGGAALAAGVGLVGIADRALRLAASPRSRPSRSRRS